MGNPTDGDIARLIAELAQGQPDVRNAAKLTLTKIGTAAVLPLIAVLAHRDRRLVFEAAQVLETIRDTRAVVPLLLLYRRGIYFDVYGFRTWGTRVIAPLVDALRFVDYVYIAHIAHILEAIGQPAVPHLLHGLNDPDDHVRLGAIMTLGVLRETRALEPLVQALRAPWWRERFKAAVALGWLGQDGALSSLLGALRDDTLAVRLVATRAIGAICCGPNLQRRQLRASLRAMSLVDHVAAALVEELRDEQGTIRLAALRALWPDPRFLDDLVPLLDDPYEQVRDEALQILVWTDSDRWLPRVIDGLQTTDERMLLKVIRTLGDLGDPRAVKPLVSQLHSTNYGVQTATIDSLQTLGSPMALPALEHLRHECLSQDPGRAALVAGVIDQLRRRQERTAG